MNRRERESRKQELLIQIQTQRMEMVAGEQQWLAATSGYDHLWAKLYGLRRYAAVGGGLLTLWAVRRPKLLGRWIKRGFGVWSSWRMVRKMIHR